MSSLDNKVAIITGAGQVNGIGRAIALKLAKLGATTILTDLSSATELERIAKEIGEESGRPCLSMHCDISQEEDIHTCVDRTLEKFACIDILVNNAGVTGSGTAFLDIQDSTWDLSYQVNIKGSMRFIKSVLPHMQKQGGGSIINNASICGLGALEAIPANYTASKFAIVGLTKAIALEFAADKIRCNAVCPGVVNTGMRQDALARIAEQMNVSIEEAEKIEDEAIAMKRAAEPEEVAEAVAYLVSPASSYITGVALPVAGGLAPGL